MAKSEAEKSSREYLGTGRFDELHDMTTDLFDAGAWRSPSNKDEKEGLPMQYKMRHDAHYVDELLSARSARQAINLPVDQITERSCETLDTHGLASSIAEFGMLQPLIVRRCRGRYELVAGAKRLAAAKALGLVEVPCWLFDVDDDQAVLLRDATNLFGSNSDDSTGSDDRTPLTGILPLLGKSFQTIDSYVRRLSEIGDSSQAPAATDQIRAEAQRATCLTWGTMLISSTPKLMVSDFDVATVLDEVLDLYEAGNDLFNVSLTKDVQDRCSLRSDRRLVFVAIRGALDTILPLAWRGRPEEVALHLSRDIPSRSVVFRVSQSVHRPPDSAWNRWFDLNWRERPGGISSGVGLLAAKRVTELLGGGLSIVPHQGPGCLLSLSFSETTTSGTE